MYFKFLFLLLFTHIALAAPWFTGPLLAPAGKTIPPGHFNFEPYGFYTEYPKGFRNLEGLPVLSIGLTNFMDLQMGVPYDYSWDQGQHGNGFGDFSLALGFQVMKQKEHSWLPDLRVAFQEVFPTGRFEHLNPLGLGTDQTGLGSYETLINFNFQQLTELKKEHYLRTRLSLVVGSYSDVTVHGVNVFGGSPTTRGTVAIDSSFSADLSFEYTLTQNWVPVFELLYVHSPATHFSGFPGFNPDKSLAGVGGPSAELLSLAPAVEYNFTSNLGIIGGVWFSVAGPADFLSFALALNYFF